MANYILCVSNSSHKDDIMVMYLREASRSVCFVMLCLLPKTAAFSVPERIAWG